MNDHDQTPIRWFEDLRSGDTPSVGGKNASLGEMLSELKAEGIRVPDGFATTAGAYRDFLDHNDLPDRIRGELDGLDEDADALEDVGEAARKLICEGDWPESIAEAIRNAYGELSRRYDTDAVDVAVRSSATAEDLPEASFAGQQETFLNVTGADDLLDACRRCFASLFTDRAISYRREQGFDHMKIALSVGVQKMVRADKAGAGVMFTLDTETGFPDVVVINASWGLGETVVAGTVNPDEYRVFKPLLDREGLRPILARRLGAKGKTVVAAEGEQTTETRDTPADKRRAFVLDDDAILHLGRWATAIEAHYDRPMDIEWARDGESGELFILQARPETVQSRKAAATLKTYRLKETGEPMVEGVAIGRAVAAGKAFVLDTPDQADRFEDDGVLVTGMTDPDWGPIMNRASAIVTDHGGRTSHAAIVSRELGIPAIVGTDGATEAVDDGAEVTVSCAEGEKGRVYKGRLDYEATELDPHDLPDTDTKIMMNLASPGAAVRWWNLPCDGIGLARMEFIINNLIKIHPLALVRFDELTDDEARETIEAMTAGYDDKREYFVERLARGIARIASVHYPHPAIVRLSDFKTNEYANLIGGKQFEPDEANPMLGFRGAARYDSDRYRDGFALECAALRRAREEIGLDNIIAMIPFCRTPEEADRVLEAMARHGLKRGIGGFQVYCMAEIPSNIVRARAFAERIDGFSIGTNDLTQLVLGIDRDNADLAGLFDARDEAVKQMIRQLIDTAHDADVPAGICGQAPSDHPDFAEFLVDAGIDSISVNPDSVVEVRRHVAEAERHPVGASQ
ncbi:MAG: phosphoenolpyruvate synthase [Planctomycetota bacterium]